MLKLNRDVEYALIALNALASAGEQEEPCSARTISERYRIPVELLSKILQRLARAGLIHSQFGARGGYRLARTADSITIGEAMQAVEGPLQIVPCLGEEGECKLQIECTIHGGIGALQHALARLLGTFTLADLADPGQARSPEPARSAARPGRQ